MFSVKMPSVTRCCRWRAEIAGCRAWQQVQQYYVAVAAFASLLLYAIATPPATASAAYSHTPRDIAELNKMPCRCQANAALQLPLPRRVTLSCHGQRYAAL